MYTNKQYILQVFDFKKRVGISGQQFQFGQYYIIILRSLVDIT